MCSDDTFLWLVLIVFLGPMLIVLALALLLK